MSTSVSIRRKAIVGTIATAIAASLALATPIAAQASVPASVSSVTWNVRTSWVNYVTNPAWYLGLGQGSVTRTASNGGTSAVAAGSATTGYSGFTNYAYSYAFGVASDTGTPRTVTLKGGLDFDMSVHGIDISIKDIRIVEKTGDEDVYVDATYKPLMGSTVTANDIVAFTLADSPNAAGEYVLTLTAAGAAIFNGGDNGSYEEGEEFGSLEY